MKTLEQARTELERTPPFPRSEYNAALEALIDAKIAVALHLASANKRAEARAEQTEARVARLSAALTEEDPT